MNTSPVLNMTPIVEIGLNSLNINQSTDTIAANSYQVSKDNNNNYKLSCI